MMTDSTSTIPKAFIWRRLHSLMGFWLAIYLIFHLLTNSQAALFFGDDGIGFIRSVNSIHELPYLIVIEGIILGFPIFVHLLWGIKYLFTAKYNSFGDSGKQPYLPKYSANHTYTWQRITSWLLIIGLVAHIIHMRIIEYPEKITRENHHFFLVKVSADDGLYTLAPRLGVKIEKLKEIDSDGQITYQNTKKVLAEAPDFGTAELLMVRNTFKMPIMLVLYTLFVLSASFHAFNGLWTFMISWGVTLSQHSQNLMKGISIFLMILVSFLGLSAIWLTYWINLKQ